MTGSVDLLQAAGRGDLGRLKELLDAGCDPNLAHSISGNTALYNACFLDSVEVVKLLLSRGANPNHRMTYRGPRLTVCTFVHIINLWNLNGTAARPPRT